MNNNFLEIYNNLIKLTRNKNLYNSNFQDTFYDRIIIFFFHLAFLLKEYKNKETKNNLQNFFDYCIRQIELSIREIGYGDATINKKMKEYVNLLFSVIDKIDLWEDMDNEKKIEIIKLFIEDGLNFNYFLNYLEKYRFFLSKNTFNSLSKEILTLKI
ncbi:ubiquinol-cytochrome C reductase [Pelagibacteraceae bacterium GOM-A2]|nr:ubiquinol-cytochrome C reductase [Pelagibacteraceae bacterium GOM-A2]